MNNKQFYNYILSRVYPVLLLLLFYQTISSKELIKIKFYGFKNINVVLNLKYDHYSVNILLQEKSFIEKYTSYVNKNKKLETKI